MTEFVSGRWAYRPSTGETLRIIAESEVWGHESVQVLDAAGDLSWIPVQDLVSVSERDWTSVEIAWRASAARAAHFMARGEPVALSLGSLEPLPHQLSVLDRALSVDPVRLLLADEVGLGKTIEAGLIYTELKARRRVNRVLVVAPKGVQLQWVSEMRDRFGEEFVLVGPSGIPVDAGIDPWRTFDRVICSIDSVKPVRYTDGIDPEAIDRRNEERFDRLIAAGWDMVIIDEAHQGAGASAGVARHELASALSERTKHLLLLSATPHSGKSDAFARLLGLLDVSLSDSRALTRDAVSPYVVRTEKRNAVSSTGVALFKPRITSLEKIPYGERGVERRLYEAVTDYVRHGYAAAVSDRRSGPILLLLLMQRLASSSTVAILRALEGRLASLTYHDQMRFFPEGSEDWGDLTGEEQVKALEAAKGAAWGNELAEVELLIDLARRTVAEGPDAKARYLLDLMRRLQREEADPSLKLLVFTQFRSTQEMLIDLLGQAGIECSAIHGEMDLEERKMAQDEFEHTNRVLVSTDAGGEGINLQFAHVVVNYDLPWNPMRVEQRIGRVDRIGQQHTVRAFNLVLENSIDERVVTLFEAKLATILAQLGAGKRDDVLETIGSNRTLEAMYISAIADPSEDTPENDQMEIDAQLAVEGEETLRSLIHSAAPSRLSQSDAAVWMAEAEAHFTAWSGETAKGVADLLNRIPESPAEESVPVIQGEVSGIWSLWDVMPDGSGADRDFVALFVSDSGQIRPDLADTIWVSLAHDDVVLVGSELLEPDVREQLETQGQDFAYRACRDLKPDSDWRAPVVRPRLIVRVTS